jgi:phosphopantothenoylcysteine synthetase/decarboxylase
MGKKRIKELQKQVQEAQKTLATLEKKKDKKVLKAQHKVIEELETLIGQESLRAESLVELSEEAWQEVKGLLEGLISKVKNINKS